VCRFLVRGGLRFPVSARRYRLRSPLRQPRSCSAQAVELAASITPTMPGRIYIELINYPMLFKLKARSSSTKRALISSLNAAGSSCTSLAPVSGSCTQRPPSEATLLLFL
jgi:hypothetical protein